MNQKKLISKELENTIEKLLSQPLPQERREILTHLSDYIQDKKDKKEAINLNFICTHNSRRSQFSQLWAYTAANAYGIDIHSFSGGVEVTAFNERAVASVKRMGFEIKSTNQGENPIYEVKSHSESAPLKMFSKVFDDEANKAGQFATIMTCAHADENCPVIPGAEARIPVRYEDPKSSDDTPEEAETYDTRSLQIATEMFFVFSQIDK